MKSNSNFVNVPAVDNQKEVKKADDYVEPRSAFDDRPEEDDVQPHDEEMEEEIEEMEDDAGLEERAPTSVPRPSRSSNLSSTVNQVRARANEELAERLEGSGF